MISDNTNSIIKSCTAEQSLEDSIDEYISMMNLMSEAMCPDCKARLRTKSDLK